MLSIEGTEQMPEIGGITLYCPSAQCPAQECFGHGRNEKGAYAIVLSKYAGKRLQADDQDDEPVGTTNSEGLPVVEAEDVI